MLDVAHYFFEEDLYQSLQEGFAEAKDKYRINLYEGLYERSYLYASPGSRTSSFNPDLPPFDEPVNSNLEPKGFKGGSPSVKKGYVPPTAFSEKAENPFQGVLDAPFN
jgi:hypothetical protein